MGRQQLGSGADTDIELTDILNHDYWRHRIDLGDGNYTPGVKDGTFWDALGLPASADGRSVLEIGAFDGLIAFEAERRGADRVTAVDIWPQPEPGHRPNSHTPGKRGFELAREYLDSDVEGIELGAAEISPETVGRFDIVVLSDVLSQVSEPLTAIENAVSVAEDLVVVGSSVTTAFESDPVMRFDSRTDRDIPGVWQPNIAGLTEMVRAAGCHNISAEALPVRSQSSRLPPVTGGRLREATTVYGDPACSEPVDELPDETPVNCLYEATSAARIEYCDPASESAVMSKYYQGWVPTDLVDRSASVSALHPSVTAFASESESPSVSTRFVRTVREQGLGSLLLQLPRYVLARRRGSSSATRHAVVHGTPID